MKVYELQDVSQPYPRDLSKICRLGTEFQEIPENELVLLSIVRANAWSQTDYIFRIFLNQFQVKGYLGPYRGKTKLYILVSVGLELIRTFRNNGYGRVLSPDSTQFCRSVFREESFTRQLFKISLVTEEYDDPGTSTN